MDPPLITVCFQRNCNTGNSGNVLTLYLYTQFYTPERNQSCLLFASLVSCRQDFTSPLINLFAVYGVRTNTVILVSNLLLDWSCSHHHHHHHHHRRRRRRRHERFIIIVVEYCWIFITWYVGESLPAEDDAESCSQLPPPMSSCFQSTSLLSARTSADVTSASCHVTQPADAGTPPHRAARPTTLSVTYLL